MFNYNECTNLNRFWKQYLEEKRERDPELIRKEDICLIIFKKRKETFNNCKQYPEVNFVQRKKNYKRDFWRINTGWRFLASRFKGAQHTLNLLLFIFLIFCIHMEG